MIRRAAAGQGLAEYIIVALLVAIVAVVALRHYSRATKCQYASAAAEIESGELPQECSEEASSDDGDSSSAADGLELPPTLSDSEDDSAGTPPEPPLPLPSTPLPTEIPSTTTTTTTSTTSTTDPGSCLGSGRLCGAIWWQCAGRCCGGRISCDHGFSIWSHWFGLTNCRCY